MAADTIRIFNIHLQSLKFTPQNLRYLDKPVLNTDTTFSIDVNGQASAKVFDAELKPLHFEVRQEKSASENSFNVQVYPNPAVTSSSIKITTPKSGNAIVEIYSETGQRIASQNISCSHGSTIYNCENKDGGGNLLSPGIYFIKVGFGASQKSIKLIKH